MQLLIYILVYPIIIGISLLPFRILYFFSDLIFYLLYYVIGYRKKVVMKNLKLSFPEKTEVELIEIQRKFYKHFVDVFMELIKTFTMSKKEIKKRYKFNNLELVSELAKEKGILLLGSHYANWEWIVSFSMYTKVPCYGVFTPIGNTYFNNFIIKSRERFGGYLIPGKKLVPQIIKDQKEGINAFYGLLSDQSPQLKKTFYWAPFMGVKVPVHTGAEMLSKRFDLASVFFDVKKIKRGYYEGEFTLVSKDANSMKNFELTDIFLRTVEKQIRNAPEYYFWTHNRFKHKDASQKIRKFKS